jgi:gliding motility-associated-like protein
MTSLFKLSSYKLCLFLLLFGYAVSLSAQGCVKFFGIQQNPFDLQQYKIVAIDSLTGALTALNTVTTSTAGGSVYARGITANPDEQKLYYIQHAIVGSNNFYRIKTISTINGTLGDAIVLPTSGGVPVALHYDCEENKLFLLRATTNAPINITIEYIDLAAGTFAQVLASPIIVNNFAWSNTAYNVATEEFVLASENMIYRINTATGVVSTITAPDPIKSIEINPYNNSIIAQSYDGVAHIYDIAAASFSAVNTDYTTASSANIVSSAYNPFRNRYWEMSQDATTGNYVVNYIDLNTGDIISTYPANDLTEITAGYPCTAVPDFVFEPDCAGEPIQFTDASWGAGDWQWNFGDPASGSNNTANIPSPTHTFATPGTYTVSLTISGCLDVQTRTYDVVIGETPTVNFPDNIFTCASTLNLNAGTTAGAVYLWNNGQTTSAITVNADGTYWVSVNSNGCIVQDTVTVNVGNATTGNVWAETELITCGNEMLLSAAAIEGVEYLWSNGATDTEITVSQADVYSVSVTLPNGCVMVDAVNVTLLDALNISLGSDTTLCNSNNGITIVPQISSGAALINTYAWSNGSNATQINATQSGIYSLTVTGANGNCMATDSIAVTLNELPILALNDTVIICNGDSFLLDASPVNSGDFAYIWSNAATTNQISGAEAGMYMVTVSNNLTTCQTTDTVQVNTVAQPIAYLGNDTTICSGATLLLSATPLPDSNLSYNWTTGANTPQLTIDQSGIYGVTVSNAYCSVSDTLLLTVNDPIAINFGILPTSICSESSESILLDATTPNAQTYTWLPDNGNNPIFAVSSAGVYTVTVTDLAGCSDTASAVFDDECQAVFAMPTAFSPNGDGQNDVFAPIVQFIDSYVFQVFDRWGNQVFSGNNTNPEGWTGNNAQKRAMEIGTYVWVANYTDRNDIIHELKGNVTLIR